ncbi:MAG: hypothetical protein KF858_07435 [Candidatus Sumerlaeia bacterium]|nr:hypothetical protein [Candidatus Sumerlaeia bacterium]
MKKLAIFGAALAVGLVASASATPIPIQNWDAAAAAATNVTFQSPGFSGSTGGNFVAGSTSTVINTDSVSAPNCLELSWTWAGTAAADAKGRVTTFNAVTTGSVANPVIDYSRSVAFEAKVNGAVTIVGILSRDNNDPNPGSAGTAAGAIETIAQPVLLNSSVDAGWVTYRVHIPTATISGFTGDGVLTNATGTLEALYIERAGVDTVTLRIDDLRIDDPPPPSNVESWSVYQY